MKRYIKPFLNCIEIRQEERLAACDNPGSCPTDRQYPDGDGNGNPDFLTIS